MATPKPFQHLQDWITQQWVILTGRRVNAKTDSWLLGPFGQTGTIGDAFVDHLAQQEDLMVERNCTSCGLIPSFDTLSLSKQATSKLADDIIDFYQHTGTYDLAFGAKWNPVFLMFGKLLNMLFSARLNQLNIPTQQQDSPGAINSELIALTERKSGQLKYVIWYRTFKATGKVLYSGVYTTCTTPSGIVCVKAVFPLPNGNATVILEPEVTENGAFTLRSAGAQHGDAGFYFLLQDATGTVWSRYVRTFEDTLTVQPDAGHLKAKQILRIWKQKVVTFTYRISRKTGTG